MKISTCILVMLLSLAHGFACGQTGKRTDIIEFGLKGNLKKSISRSYAIRDSTQATLENLDSFLQLVYSNYYNRKGNLDSSVMQLTRDNILMTTVYAYDGDIKSGWTKFDQQRQAISYSHIKWITDHQYVVLEYTPGGNLLNETTYILDKNYRHLTTAYRQFDSAGKLIRNNKQVFERDENGDVKGYMMENLLDLSKEYMLYNYGPVKDTKGNAIKIWMQKENPAPGNFATINEIEYSYY